MLGELDEVSSSDSSEDDGDSLEQYLQDCYYSSYILYEQEARQNKHVVDMYNYNPNNLWQNIYLHNQQIEQLMSISNLFTPPYYNFNETNQKPW